MPISQDGDTTVQYTDIQSLEYHYRCFFASPGPGNLNIISGNHFEKACSEFNSLFKKINAAGGIVKNNKGEYLFIKRLGLWDLPKGKLHKKESSRDGAIREVGEETGLTDLIITKQLPCSYHIYKNNFGKEILKETHWFEMIVKGDQNLVPQKEEDISEVRWFSAPELEIPLHATYESLRHLWGQYMQE